MHPSRTKNLRMYSSQPEKASAVINNRINVDSSYQAVEDRLIQTVLPTVAEYNLQLNGFGKLYSPNTTSPAAGLVTLSEWVFRKPCGQPSFCFYSGSTLTRPI